MNANTNTTTDRDDEPTDDGDVIVLRDQKGRSEIRRAEPVESSDPDEPQSEPESRGFIRRLLSVLRRVM